jgi:hypothetical protein
MALLRLPAGLHSESSRNSRARQAGGHTLVVALLLPFSLWFFERIFFFILPAYIFVIPLFVNQHICHFPTCGRPCHPFQHGSAWEKTKMPSPYPFISQRNQEPVAFAAMFPLLMGNNNKK